MAAVYKTITGDGSNTKANPETTKKPVRSKNQQRVLILSSRGITHLHRHFLNDLVSILPHSRKEPKFDSKKKLYVLNELAELYNCNNILFLEARKHQDLYMHLAKAPNGVTARFHIHNLQTMEELNFTGNCLKGSRAILSFDAAFDNDPSLQLIRELLKQIFGVPQHARKSKPFIDRVLGFSIVDNKIWVRHYQIKEEDTTEDKDMSLLEIGPRFCMTPMIVQEGSFGGSILFQNKHFVSPNQVRADLRNRGARKQQARQTQYAERSAKKGRLEAQRNTEDDVLDSKKLFA